MKKNIAILMGGYSGEYDISLKSGMVVFKHLNKTRYNPYRIIINKDRWVYLDADNNEIQLDRHNFTICIDQQTITFDCVFNTIHGSPGEDGYMQAYLTLLGLPHTSCDYYQAALTFNKRDCLTVLNAYGIRSAISYRLDKRDPIDTHKIIDKVGLPCFVKANRSGSSYGISKVTRYQGLIPAIENAFKEDDELLIEAFLEGTEVSVGVVFYNNKLVVLPATEIVTENDFFDYEAKYLGKAKEITPARIPENVHIKVSEIARRIYTLLKLKGFVRSDFIIVDQTPYLLEVNTIPGLTEESLLPKQAEAAGISLGELFESAIEVSLSNR